MGLYNIICPSCQKNHLWFSGNQDQRCEECLNLEKPMTPEEEAAFNKELENIMNDPGIKERIQQMADSWKRQVEDARKARDYDSLKERLEDSEGEAQMWRQCCGKDKELLVKERDALVEKLTLSIREGVELEKSLNSLGESHMLKDVEINQLHEENERLKAEFKNFHQNLCKRFDYCHDDVDWRRDQASLEEHIAKERDQALAEVERLKKAFAKSSDEWRELCEREIDKLREENERLRRCGDPDKLPLIEELLKLREENEKLKRDNLLALDISEKLANERDALGRECDLLITALDRLRNEVMIAKIGQGHYKSERDIHIKESEQFVNDATDTINSLRKECEALRTAAIAAFGMTSQTTKGYLGEANRIRREREKKK